MNRQPQSTRTVVLIAYHFPPEGNAGVYRPLRFVRELVNKGWQTTVVCNEPYQYQRYDQNLLLQVPPTTRIVRVKGLDPWRAVQTWRGERIENKLAGSPSIARPVVAGHHAHLRSKVREAIRTIEAWIYRPDIAMPWIRPTVREIMTICHQSRPDVIWATIGPLSSGVVAYKASISTRVPYVLDFRDPWGLDYYAEEIRRPAWARSVDNNIMRRMFERAQAVIFLFESIAERYVRTFSGALDRSKIHIIPNGFEGAVESFFRAPGLHCKVLYAGTLSSYRYDTLLEGLVRLRRQDSDRAKKLKLLFVGENFEEMANRVANLDIQDMVEIAPSTSHSEILRLQREAHALLVLGRRAGRTGHELVAGAKLFGYLQAGRPIIGILPNDETRRILKEVGSTLIADANSPAEVVTVFERVINAWSNRTLESLVPNRAACDVYSSSRQISALVAALDGERPLKLLTTDCAGLPLNLQSQVGR
jgi:hypothetical protein